VLAAKNAASTDSRSGQMSFSSRTGIDIATEIQGKFTGNARGFGFVSPKSGEGRSEDIFIPPHATGGALDGDIVTCTVTKMQTDDENKPSITGKITGIVERGALVGSFFITDAQGYIRAVESKIPHTFAVPPKTVRRLGLVDGHRVVFYVDKRDSGLKGKQLRRFSSDSREAPLRSNGQDNCVAGSWHINVTEIIGHINDPGTDVLSLVIQAGVPYKFPQATMDEAEALPWEVSDEECRGRLDLRTAAIFTIDGEDTKDIDDAISFEQLPDGNVRLGVHIADVSHYVKPGSALDTAAHDRGTSIYLADRVIPMLPHRLSSGICSLLPNVDRLTLSCIMTVSAHGEVTDYEIAQSVINSKRRFTYDEVQEILDHGEDETFSAMDHLRATLRQNREAKGALDFNLPESQIRVDETGAPISITPRYRTNATGIIEEFMILCNETVAAHALRHELPFVFRTHEPPSSDKITRLATLVKSLGFSVPVNAESPKILQRLLKKTGKTAQAQAIATAVLHSLPQARYTNYDPTHYGLASDGYCHFTSPIRRYADLQVHRIIKSPRQPWENLPVICAQASTTERVAEQLEREVAQLKKVQFMSALEGQNFDGVVSGVTAWGVYVTLPNTVEGIVPYENLARHHFKFDKDTATYIRVLKKGSKKMVLRHGVELSVRLARVDVDDLKIVFSVIC